MRSSFKLVPHYPACWTRSHVEEDESLKQVNDHPTMVEMEDSHGASVGHNQYSGQSHSECV